MPVFILDQEISFPNIHFANPEGVLAIGGDLTSERLILAYQMGIFPWFNKNELPVWWSPDPRCVIKLQELKVSKSLKTFIRNHNFRVSVNRAFAEVLESCAQPRKGQRGTWLSAEMKAAYSILHDKKLAHSIEVWDGDDLVGGLYGTMIGKVFCGESMFAKASNASKLGLFVLVQHLLKWDCEIIDCQIYNPHLGSLGASEISRKKFQQLLTQSSHLDLSEQWASDFDDQYVHSTFHKLFV